MSERIAGWDQRIDEAEFGYNTSVHESSGMSPYEVFFGIQLLC